MKDTHHTTVQYVGGRYFVTYFTRTTDDYYGPLTSRVVMTPTSTTGGETKMLKTLKDLVCSKCGGIMGYHRNGCTG